MKRKLSLSAMIVVIVVGAATMAVGQTTTRPSRGQHGLEPGSAWTRPTHRTPTTTTAPPVTTTTTSPRTPGSTTTTAPPVTTTTTSPRTPGSTTTTAPPVTTSTSTTSTSTTTTAPVSPRSWWRPPTGKVEWQWELDHPLDLTSATDMGVGETTYTGAPAGAPSVYDIDGIENPASTVADLHALGDHVICYIEVGAAGDYYGNDDGSTSYYAELQAAGDLGSKMQGYDESYLDINAPSTVAIIEKMIHDQCYAKGFDAVEPDIDDSWYDSTGFNITMADEITYLTTLSNYAHSLGLGWGFKDGDQAPSLSDSAQFASDLVANHVVDFDIDEQCFQTDTCSVIYPLFANAGLAVFEAEYQGSNTPADFCPTANADDFNSVLFDNNLDGLTRVPCR